MSIKSICETYGIANYYINKDNTINVYGDVYLTGLNIYKLRLNFNKVSGSFNFYNNKLITLKGIPKYIGGDLILSLNHLKELDYLPEYVGGNFDCSSNQLHSLQSNQNILEIVKGRIICGYQFPTSSSLLPYNNDMLNDYISFNRDKKINEVLE